ncbi:MAG: DUF4079 domain-containing protein [Cyanobacteriota bacterium]|jgi:hypothetical protein
MQTVDWLMILHPALAVLVIFPLVGQVLRLGLQTRQRRLEGAKLPPTVGRDHAELGRWLSTAAVLVALVALTVVIGAKAAVGLAGGAGRGLQLLLVLIGTLVALAALWQVRAAPLRLAFSLITWAGVLALGAQPEVWRLSDNPFSAGFWQSHYWAAAGAIGLLLFFAGARPEITRQGRWRSVHVVAGVLTGVLLVVLAITGSRDLLEIPLSWQQGHLQACDWAAQVCPPSTQK